MKAITYVLFLSLFILNITYGQVNRTGSFVPGSSAYPISGDVTVTNNAGAITVDFESNFATVQGINLEVFLGKTATLNTNTDLQISTSPLDAGSAMSTPITGPITFAVPAGVNLFDYNNVLVYCTTANVLWGYANLCESTLMISSGVLPSDTYLAEQDIISTAILDINSVVIFETQNSITLNPDFEVPLSADFTTILGAGNGCIIE